MAELTEEEVVAMEEQTAAYRAQQQQERDLADAQAAIIEEEAVTPLMEFVESEQFAQFVKTAEENRDANTGRPLVAHLDGALISLNVVRAQVTATRERFRLAHATVEAAEQ